MTVLFDRLRLLSLREFATHRGRTAASVAVVTISAAFLVAMMGISGSITGSAQRLATGIAGNAALEVSGVTEGGFSQAIQRDVSKVPGVVGAVPMLRMSAATSSGPVLLLGVDATSVMLDSDLKNAVQHKVSALLTVPNGVLVGPAIGRAKGESFVLGSGQVTVADVLQGKALEQLNGGHYVLAPLALAQRITGRDGQLDSVLVVAAPGIEVSTLHAAVTNVVAGRAVVADPSARAAQVGNGIRILQYMTLMGVSLAFVVGAFLIYIAMGMAITQRRPAISTLRAMGARGTTIVRDLLTEAAFLGMIGGVIGSAVGVVLGSVAIERLPGGTTQAVQARTDYILPIDAIPIAIAVAVITSVGASAVAARQIYKVRPIEALAPIEVSVAGAIRPWVRVTAAAGAVVLIVATCFVVIARIGTLTAAALVLPFTAAILLCFAFADPMVRAVARTARLFGASGALAGITVERAPRRVWATTMTVFTAVAATVGISGSNGNTIDSAKEAFAPLAEPAFWVSSTETDRYPTGPLLPADLAAKVAAVPGVAKVTEEQLLFAELGDTTVLVHGVSAGSDDPLSWALDEQVREQILAGRGIALSRDLGKALGVGVGDDLQLRTPSGIQRIKVLELVPYFSLLVGNVAIDIGRMREWFDRPGSTLLQVDVVSGVNRDGVFREIQLTAPDYVHVYSGSGYLDGTVVTLRQATAVTDAIWVTVAFIAAVALLNTLMLSVLERRRELGVLRAMGSSRRFALRMILAEAAGIGIVGGLLGLFVGLVNQYLYTVISTDFMNFDVDYRPSSSALLFAAASLVLSLLGSLPPALWAARLGIIEAVSVD